jgi:hypothetical protein
MPGNFASRSISSLIPGGRSRYTFRTMAKEADNYLQYLDKEMTIMGILSTFCVAVVALVLDRVGSAEPMKGAFFYLLWKNQSFYVVSGSACVALAAAFFYQQRSALAWFYGQISLSIDCPEINGTDTAEWLEDADSWATWIPYQSAFSALTVGCSLYLYAIMASAQLFSIPGWLLWGAIGVGVPIQATRMLILRHYKYEDDPIGRFFQKPKSKAT